MKVLLLVLGIIAAMTGIGTPALAQNYPWCAHYDKGGGGLNCGFTSFAQCLTDISGLGGFCEQNNTYRPPISTAAHPVRHKPLTQAAPRTGRGRSR
jgi:hypothetical protein